MDYALNAIVLGSIYALFTIGMSLSWGVLNVLNLAHGSIFMSGALTAYLLTKSQPLPLAVVMPAGVLVSGGLVVLLEVAAFRPIRKRAESPHAAEMPIVIASVGASSVLVAAANLFTSGYGVSIAQQTFRPHTFRFAGFTISDIELVIIVAALGLTGLLSWFVNRTRHGRALKVVALDTYAAGLFGISVERLALATMFVSGTLAGCAGILMALQQNSVSANMGDSLLLKAFAAIVLGGIGSIWAAALGAYVLAAAEITAIVLIGVGLRDVVAFILIIVLLLLRPAGLFAKKAWQRS